MTRVGWLGAAMAALAVTAVGFAFAGPDTILDKKFPIRTIELTDTKEPAHVPGHLLVRFKDSVSTAAADKIHRDLEATVQHRYKLVSGLVLVELPERTTLDAGIAAYQDSGAVLYAERDHLQYTIGMPDDPRFGSLWGLHNTGQSGGSSDADINAPEAWEITTGSKDTVIAVIDTGLDYNHVDLAANMWTNPGEIAGNGVDDDNNGYVDDMHGINARNDSGDPMDGASHGTHCTGTIAGVGDNGTGVTGVSWNATIIGCNFLGSGSGSTSDGVKCLDYLYDLKTREQNPVNIVASNNSWGGGGFEQSLHDAIAAHAEVDILFVAAAGNDGGNNDNGPHYPSNYELPNIISVASSTRSDNLSGFSNYGRQTVHVAAPGSSILSTTPNGNYSSFSGTSMAAPHVSGLVGLLKSQDPTRTGAQIKNLIMLGGEPTQATLNTTISGTRIRAADDGGRGSLTCSGQFLEEQLTPKRDSSLVFRHDGFGLSSMSIECDGPSGDVTVVAQPGDVQVPLYDDGTHGDSAANDGVFTLDWIAPEPGEYTLTFPTGEERFAEIFDETYRPPVAEPMVWREISGAGFNFGDDETETITPPFNVMFNGGHPASATGLIVSSNGQISVTDDYSSAGNPTLPTGNMLTVIAPFWDDLNPATGGDVFWEVIGTEPNRELVVEWRAVRHYDCGNGTITFQVVFPEGSADIIFNYQDVTFGNADCDAGASATVGMQVTDRRAIQYLFGSPRIAEGSALRWTLNNLPAVDAGPDLVVTPGSSVTLDATINDPDGTDTVQTIAWTQLDGEAVALSDPAAATTTFTAPQTSGILDFQVAATDDAVVTVRDDIKVTVDIPPIALAGADQKVKAGADVMLSGADSYDEDGTIVSYVWAQVDGPEVHLHDEGVMAHVKAPGSGTATFELTVTDDLGVSSSDLVAVSVEGDQGCSCAIGTRPGPKALPTGLAMLVLAFVAFRRRRTA